MSKDKIHDGCEGSGAALAGELSDAQLEQITGGVTVRPKLIAKALPTSVSWSGTPYQPDEDVEAY
jgi:hypothetical protein